MMKSYLIWSLFALLLLALCAAIYAVLRYRSRTLKLENENRLLKIQQANMEQLLNEIRAERHDFIKHLQALEHLSEQRENGTLTRYLDEVKSDLRHMNEILRGEKGHMASLLSHIIKESALHHVRVELDLGVPLSSMPVGLAEQTKLAGNLLENALEAAKKYAKANHEAVIEIFSSIRSGLYLLEIRNSTLPISGEVLDRLFKTPVTPGKGDGGSSWRHGIGAYVVAETVKKHNGYLDFTYQPPILSVKIKIPVVKE